MIEFVVERLHNNKWERIGGWLDDEAAAWLDFRECGQVKTRHLRLIKEHENGERTVLAMICEGNLFIGGGEA